MPAPLRFKKHDGVWLSKGEKWPKRKRKGIRPEGYDLRNTWREPNGRFSKPRSHARKGKKK